MTIKVSPLQNSPVPAQLERISLENRSPGIGIMGLSDMKVSAGSGMGSTVAPGRARIRSNQGGSANEGVQDVLIEVPEVVVHSTADPTNPRMDLVYVRMQDAALSGAVNRANIGIIAGTPNVGTTLITRTGVGSIPAGAILLGDVLIPAGASSSASFQFRDRRQFGSYGVVPPIRFASDAVAFIYPSPPMAGASLSVTGAAGFQWSCLAYLPRTITATKIRWMYTQSASTAWTGNYCIGIYDSSGRKVVDTGSVAYTGAINTVQYRAETIPSTLFEAGLYHIAYGDTGTAGANDLYTVGNSVGNQAAMFGGNGIAYVTSGGVAMPTVLNHIELTGNSPFALNTAVPAVVLSSV